jgi:hypothetical protein
MQLASGETTPELLRFEGSSARQPWGSFQRLFRQSRISNPALHRLEDKGWIRAEWGASENHRKAKYYSLTRAGQKQLDAELENWGRISTAISLVLQ